MYVALSQRLNGISTAGFISDSYDIITFSLGRKRGEYGIWQEKTMYFSAVWDLDHGKGQLEPKDKNGGTSFK
jgi:hypothetical protein